MAEWHVNVNEQVALLAYERGFEAGREEGAGDMERIERHARADELEAWAAATLRRANEVRANVGLEPPELDSDWHGDAYDRLIERSQNVVNFRRHDSWIWLAVTGGPAVAVMSADETADLAANLWAAAKAAREPNQIRQGDPET